MFCSKCGTKVADDDYACYKCGARLNNGVRSSLDVLNEQESSNKEKPIIVTRIERADKVRQPEKPSKDANVNIPEIKFADIDTRATSRKRKNYYLTISLVSAVILLALVVFIVVMFGHSSVNVVKEASQTDSVEEITDIVEPEPAVAEPTPEEVLADILTQADELKNNYLEEELTYDETLDEFDKLKAILPMESAEFNEDIEFIENIHTSRRNYDKGIEKIDEFDFEGAVEDLSLVIEEDTKYYQLAQDAITGCDILIAELLVGQWSYEYDIHDEVVKKASEAGYDLSSVNIKMPITFIFTLGEDGTIKVSTDMDKLREYMDKMIDIVAKELYNEVASKGLSEKEINLLLQITYGTTNLSDFIKEQFDYENYLTQFEKQLNEMKIDNYRVEERNVYIGEVCLIPSFAEDEMTLSSENGNTIKFGDYEFKLPITMQRYIGGSTPSSAN